MTIPTEPIGSISRPSAWIETLARVEEDHPSVRPLHEEAVREAALGTGR